ncbi:hypothetical protein DFA_10043 [Cavenderia fasciculata]|uniref:Uncharacterized protein n=1 Tax=Cavenderia fasciculata TaxID=261658 RepID=F4Q944_CACFS|nr:uncharacterized protein DFA_10043 [Cavenderia fasciculata]EGG15213.1 hypothetical protein DFA_10043 [Cavenderia fasciculata]|eukprot:XP_004351933.1 hypothetical protein DFA_10043 [Cavenderia fasciculata]
MTVARDVWLSGLDVTIVGNPGVGKNTFVQSLFGDKVRLYDKTDYITSHVEIVNQLDNYVKWNYQFCHLESKFYIVLKGELTNDSGLHNYLYSRTNIIFILFDVTNLQSFESLMKWCGNTNKYGKYKFETVVIIGTKRDLVNQRKVTREQANDFALGLGFSYFEVGKDDDDDTCIDRVYSIIARHLYENICKNVKSFEEGRLYLELDSISPPPPPQTTTTTTTTTIKDQLFYSVFRSKYIRTNIFKQITTIHSDLNVQLARGIGIPNISFWCSNRYINVLKYYQKTKLPIEINNIAKLSSILRMPDNSELLQYIVENIGRLLDQNEKNQIMNQVIVGGDLSIVKYLYSKGYYWTNEGLLMAIAFNHIDIVKFLVNYDKIEEWRSLTDPRTIDMCIGAAKSYNRKEIEILLSPPTLKKPTFKLFDKLSNMFSK